MEEIMKEKLLIVIILLIFSIAATGIVKAADSRAPAGFGRNYNEIITLAKKEGKVRFTASNPDDKEAVKFLQPFKDKYGIDVEYTRETGAESRERVLLEIAAGRVEYDALQISPEVVGKYRKLSAIAGPFDWRTLFGIKPVFIGPERDIVASGSSSYSIAYNPDLVPKNRIPRRWEDFLDPWWKGKFVVDPRPKTFTTLYPAWGKKKLLDFSRALAANKPIWKRNQTEVVVSIAAGEYLAFCGAYTSSILRILGRDPSAKLAISIPTEMPANHFNLVAVLKGATHPNAGLLLAGWLASADGGQKQYDAISHRGSPLVEGTRAEKMVREAGAKVLFSGWGYTPEQEAEVDTWILNAWGFPTEKK
jgi:iron(III) transport system substrate-binding protein